MILWLWNLQNRQVHGESKELNVVLGVLELDSSVDAQLCNCTEATELDIFKGWILWYVNCVALEAVFKKYCSLEKPNCPSTFKWGN